MTTNIVVYAAVCTTICNVWTSSSCDDKDNNDDNNRCLCRCLDNELRRLCEYARLSPEEQDACEAAMEHVRAVSAALFSGTTDNDDNDRVEIFGLFATLDVCVFLSNVDLSLWGVVEPTENKEEDKKPKS